MNSRVMSIIKEVLDEMAQSAEEKAKKAADKAAKKEKEAADRAAEKEKEAADKAAKKEKEAAELVADIKKNGAFRAIIVTVPGHYRRVPYTFSMDSKEYLNRGEDKYITYRIQSKKSPQDKEIIKALTDNNSSLNKIEIENVKRFKQKEDADAWLSSMGKSEGSRKDTAKNASELPTYSVKSGDMMSVKRGNTSVNTFKDVRPELKVTRDREVSNILAAREKIYSVVEKINKLVPTPEAAKSITDEQKKEISSLVEKIRNIEVGIANKLRKDNEDAIKDAKEAGATAPAKISRQNILDIIRGVDITKFDKDDKLNTSDKISGDKPVNEAKDEDDDDGGESSDQEVYNFMKTGGSIRNLSKQKSNRDTINPKGKEFISPISNLSPELLAALGDEDSQLLTQYVTGSYPVDREKDVNFLKKQLKSVISPKGSKMEDDEEEDLSDLRGGEDEPYDISTDDNQEDDTEIVDSGDEDEDSDLADTGGEDSPESEEAIEDEEEVDDEEKPEKDEKGLGNLSDTEDNYISVDAFDKYVKLYPELGRKKYASRGAKGTETNRKAKGNDIAPIVDTSKVYNFDVRKSGSKSETERKKFYKITDKSGRIEKVANAAELLSKEDPTFNTKDKKSVIKSNLAGASKSERENIFSDWKEKDPEKRKSLSWTQNELNWDEQQKDKNKERDAKLDLDGFASTTTKERYLNIIRNAKKGVNVNGSEDKNLLKRDSESNEDYAQRLKDYAEKQERRADAPKGFPDAKDIEGMIIKAKQGINPINGKKDDSLEKKSSENDLEYGKRIRKFIRDFNSQDSLDSKEISKNIGTDALKTGVFAQGAESSLEKFAKDNKLKQGDNESKKSFLDRVSRAMNAKDDDGDNKPNIKIDTLDKPKKSNNSKTNWLLDLPNSSYEKVMNFPEEEIKRLTSLGADVGKKELEKKGIDTTPVEKDAKEKDKTSSYRVKPVELDAGVNASGAKIDYSGTKKSKELTKKYGEPVSHSYKVGDTSPSKNYKSPEKVDNSKIDAAVRDKMASKEKNRQDYMKDFEKRDSSFSNLGSSNTGKGYDKPGKSADDFIKDLKGKSKSEFEKKAEKIKGTANKISIKEIIKQIIKEELNKR